MLKKLLQQYHLFSCVVYSFVSFELFYFQSIALYGSTMYVSLG